MAGPKKNYPYMIEAAKKRQQVIELKRQGHTLEEIATMVGYGSRGAVRNALVAGLNQARKDMYASAELYRAEAIGRYEALLKAIWVKAMAGDEKAIAEARRLVDSIADVSGAKSPVRIQIEEGQIDALLAGLDQVLNGRAAEDPPEVVDGEIVGEPGGAQADD